MFCRVKYVKLLLKRGGRSLNTGVVWNACMITVDLRAFFYPWFLISQINMLRYPDDSYQPFAQSYFPTITLSTFYLYLIRYSDMGNLCNEVVKTIQFLPLKASE